MGMIHDNHARNRTAAILRMLEAIPAARTTADVERQAAALERYTSEQRACWAFHCGMKKEPSSDTWAMLCAAARARKPLAADPFARVQMSEGGLS